jgi:hypothetical protein
MQLFKARDNTRFFQIEHYKALLDVLSLLGGRTHGIAPLDARLLFFWSQSVVRDELKSRKRAVSLLFFDFVEARALLPVQAVPSIVWDAAQLQAPGRTFADVGEAQAKEGASIPLA